jgi:hypothetical protein
MAINHGWFNCDIDYREMSEKGFLTSSAVIQEIWSRMETEAKI